MKTMSKQNVYAIMSAVFLAIIIMGGVTTYFLLPHGVDTPKVQTSNLLLGTGSNAISSSTPNLIATKNESIIMPHNSNPRTMSLSGTGKVTIKANQAIIVLGVYTEGKSAEYAEQENALKMTDVMNSLKALGIPDTDMQTISYTINPEYDYDLKMTVGYQVTNTLQITVNDLTKVGSIIDSTSSAGANTISSVTFAVSDADFAKYKLQVYSLAVADVQAKAKAITDGFGVSIAGIQSINESYYFPTYRNVYMPMDSKAQGTVASTPIVSGTLDISVTLNVVYLLS